jgi:PleD family two-component response regulator
MKTNNNFHILIVDDEKFNIELAAVYLKEEGYSLSFALNAKAAIQSVHQKDIDLILLDINMPKTDGFEVCKMLKDDIKTKDIPVVFLTAQTDIEYISRAFEVGGVDYISKPFNAIELKIRVKTHLKNVAYLDEIKHKQSKLAQISITDPLTKLYNSLYFDSQIRDLQNKEEDFWFMYIKLERFDKINKVYGFYSANKILRLFSKLLEEVSYSNAKISKLYSVSFGILLKDYDKKSVKKLYESIVLGVSKDKNLSKMLSFKVVCYHSNGNFISMQEIYKKLESTMYKLNEQERDRFLFIK